MGAEEGHRAEGGAKREVKMMPLVQLGAGTPLVVTQHGLHPILEGGEGLCDRPPERQHDELDEVELELRLGRLQH